MAYSISADKHPEVLHGGRRPRSEVQPKLATIRQHPELRDSWRIVGAADQCVRVGEASSDWPKEYTHALSGARSCEVESGGTMVDLGEPSTSVDRVAEKGMWGVYSCTPRVGLEFRICSGRLWVLERDRLGPTLSKTYQDIVCTF